MSENIPALAQPRDLNPFGNPGHALTPRGGNALADAATAREMAEVQAAMVMAHRFPRDPQKATDAILNACTRSTLAGVALYTYARGGSEISGPSIRLAEVLAQQWGHVQFGIRELEQRDGESTVEAYAWDLLSNLRVSKVFQVAHIRHTKQGQYRLTDPRDIYELTANQGARRLRACILAVIPGDVTEAAVAMCEDTLRAKVTTTPESLRAMVTTFGELGVTQRQIEAFCQCRLEAIRPAQVLRLRKIYTSIKDEISHASDWFGAPPLADAAPEGGNPAAPAQGASADQPRRRGRPTNAERAERAAATSRETQPQPGTAAEGGPDQTFGQRVVGPAAGESPAPTTDDPEWEDGADGDGEREGEGAASQTAAIDGNLF